MQFPSTQIESDVLRILDDMTQDWDLLLDESMGRTTLLVADLGFASIDIIHLVVALEEHFEHGKLGFEQLLMRDGQYIEDLSVADLVDFLTQKLNS